jgi:tRNA pseudouridine38-40 synthase
MKMKNQRFKLTLEYVGTRFHGWQIQGPQRTVQGVLEATISKLAGTQTRVFGASRTDSGVHALAQVAHFDFIPRDTIPNLQTALNALLPWDVQALSVESVPRTFHAQRSALRKRYEYRIRQGPVRHPFDRHRVLQHDASLSVSKMQSAAQLLLGRKDFSGFASARTTVKNRVRTVSLVQLVEPESGLLLFRIEADGFLQYMVRNIVGTLLEVGEGKRAPDSLKEILDSKDRRLAGPTAPPLALYLVGIWY